ncbi:hypothetical protein BDV32DRAFT_72618 [Aspergillus pseudonomiae]|nr:hypothetical protein BDV32DRAFT_72618 [Aspergillus pseudonomiae]
MYLMSPFSLSLFCYTLKLIVVLFFFSFSFFFPPHCSHLVWSVLLLSATRPQWSFCVSSINSDPDGQTGSTGHFSSCAVSSFLAGVSFGCFLFYWLLHGYCFHAIYMAMEKVHVSNVRDDAGACRPMAIIYAHKV